MRSLPISVLNPNTAGQISNRTRFSSISILAAACLTTIVKPLNDRFAAKMSGYNAFCQRCKEAFTGEGVFVPANLILSSGKLGATPIESATMSSLRNLSVTFNSTPEGSYQMATDKAYLLVVNEDGAVLGSSSGAKTRNDSRIDMVLDAEIAPSNDVYVYLSFIRTDGSIVGNSTMLIAIV
jgi:hypothetical protein